MKKYKWIIMSLCLPMIFTGCAGKATKTNDESNSVTNEQTENKPNTQLESQDVNDASDLKKDITSEFAVSSDSGQKVDEVNGVYTITKSGEYTVSGKLEEGQIVVDADEGAEITLILKDTSISCSSGSPINIIQADKVKIKAEEDTYNEINDLRTTKPSDSEDSEENAAIYSTADLNIAGKGALVVNAGYNNGIHTKNDLSVKNLTMKVNALNNALKGNDSVTIESGEIILNSENGHGIKTKNNDVSAKGNQRGDITIDGGNIVINASQDGINAAHDFIFTKANLYVECGDDGIHGDNVVTINSGSINIPESHEGIEGNNVIINEGEVYVYGKDDGINSGKGANSPLIQINGGYVEITTPSGDTDGIDSNGSYEQTGGTVLVKGGAAMGNMAGSVDVDGTITVTGGTIVALGGICETPVNSCNAYASNGTKFEAGKYKIASSDNKVIMEFELTTSYSSCWVCSENLETNVTYSITKDNAEILSWTQEEGTMGASGGMGGPGGFGGGHGFGGNQGFENDQNFDGERPFGNKGNHGQKPDNFQGGFPEENNA